MASGDAADRARRPQRRAPPRRAVPGRGCPPTPRRDGGGPHRTAASHQRWLRRRVLHRLRPVDRRHDGERDRRRPPGASRRLHRWPRRCPPPSRRWPDRSGWNARRAGVDWSGRATGSGSWSTPVTSTGVRQHAPRKGGQPGLGPPVVGRVVTARAPESDSDQRGVPRDGPESPGPVIRLGDDQPILDEGEHAAAIEMEPAQRRGGDEAQLDAPSSELAVHSLSGVVDRVTDRRIRFTRKAPGRHPGSGPVTFGADGSLPHSAQEPE